MIYSNVWRDKKIGKSLETEMSSNKRTDIMISGSSINWLAICKNKNKAKIRNSFFFLHMYLEESVTRKTIKTA